MKKHKLGMGRLFYSNKFTAVFSLAVAVIIWLSVVIMYSPEDRETFRGVPIQISSAIPEKYGLNVFEQTQTTVDITVSGKRYLLSELKNSPQDDVFKVTAVTEGVIDSGEYTLKIKVEKVEEFANFTIEEYTPQEIRVFYDKRETKEDVPLEIRFVRPDGTRTSLYADDFSPDQIVGKDCTCFADEIYALSTKTVRVSGAQSSLDKVSSVKAEVALDALLTESASYDLNAISKLIPVRENGGSISYLDPVTESGGEDPIRIEVPVYRVVELPVELRMENAPQDLDVETMCSYTLYAEKTSVNRLRVALNTALYGDIGSTLPLTLDWNEIADSGSRPILSLTEEDHTAAMLGDGVRLLNESVTIQLDLRAYYAAHRAEQTTA